jgi:hypothetical protein
VDGSGTLQISSDLAGSPGIDDVTINRVVNSSGPFVQVNGILFPEGGIKLINIQDGFHNVIVRATSKSLVAGNEDAFFVGTLDEAPTRGSVPPVGFGNMQNIRAGLSLNSARTVVLDDATDLTGRNVTMEVLKGGIAPDLGVVQHMAPADILFNTQGGLFNSNTLDQLSLYGGHGHNTFNILDTPAAFSFFQNQTHTSIFTGADGDTVNVLRTTSLELDIQGQSGRDTVNIGNNGSLQGIQSQVTVKTGSSLADNHTALFVDGSAGTSPQNVFMGRASDNPRLFAISGLLPGNNAIEYDDTHTNFVAVKAGQGGTFTVDDTTPNGPTQIDTGTGSSKVTVHNTHGQLSVTSRAHADITIGNNHSLLGIQGAIHVSNPPSFSTLTLDGSADNVNRIFDLSATQTQGLIDGLGSVAQISYNPGDISNIHIIGDQAFEGYFVRSTAGAAAITIDGLGFKDNFFVGNFNNSLDDIHNPLTLNGSIFGFDRLFVHDEGSVIGHFLFNNGSQITRAPGPVTINYALMNSVQLFPSPLPVPILPDPGFPAATDLALSDSIRAGQPATLSGRLTDANPDQVLSLRVDWGDGSPAEQRTPNRAPIRLTHRYETPGTYKVFVMWSDGLGQSNSRELTLTVLPALHGEHDGHDGHPESGDHDADAGNRLDALFALLGKGDGHHHD